MAKTKRYESQRRADKAYTERIGKEARNRQGYRSKAFKFVREMANDDELKELSELIKERLKK